MSDPEASGDKQDTRFKPGQSGNPAGRPKGSRNKLGEDFIRALQEDFEACGKEAVERVRTEKPDAYLKVIASILPKQAEIKIDNYEHMDDGQLRAALSAAIRDLEAFGVNIGLGTGDDGSQTSEGEPISRVPTLQ